LCIDEKPRRILFTLSDETPVIASKFVLLSNTVNSDQQQTLEPTQEQKTQASENTDLLIADKSLL